MSRCITVNKIESRFTVTDTVENQGNTESPVVLLYRMNMEISFDTGTLRNPTKWKMMDVHDCVLGIEPDNCTPDGRDVMRNDGKLCILRSGEIAVSVQLPDHMASL